MCGQARHFVIGQPRAQRQGLQRTALGHQFLEAAQIFRFDLDQLADLGDRRIHIGDLVRRDFERVAGEVARQHHPIAVCDDAAIGHDGHHVDTITLCHRVKIFLTYHLQIEETYQQQYEQHQPNETQAYEQPQPEEEDFALMVLQLDLARHSSFGSWCVRRSACNSSVSGAHSNAELTLPRKNSHAT